MSFFQKSDGSAVEKKNTASVGGFQKLIPDGTQLQCAIAGAVWNPPTDYYNKHISVQLHVTEAGVYRGFKHDHKLHVFDKDPKKKDKAFDILMAYDQICKGLISKADDEGKEIVGDNGLLNRALSGGCVIVTFGVFTPTDRATGEPELRTNGSVKEIQIVNKIQPKPGASEEAKAADVKAESQGMKPADKYADYDDDLDIF